MARQKTMPEGKDEFERCIDCQRVFPQQDAAQRASSRCRACACQHPGEALRYGAGLHGVATMRCTRCGSTWLHVLLERGLP